MKILVADDDAASRMILDATLRKLGHEVVACNDGQDAWTVFKKDYYPVLITDWIMPKINGAMLCHAIRETYREKYTYIVVLTVLDGKANYLVAMDAGADDFITKPFDEDQLAARLRVAERILGLHEHIHRLEGLLPICSYCKNIRNNDGSWQEIDAFMHERSEIRFSHGICPNCFQKYVKPELDQIADR